MSEHQKPLRERIRRALETGEVVHTTIGELAANAPDKKELLPRMFPEAAKGDQT